MSVCTVDSCKSNCPYDVNILFSFNTQQIFHLDSLVFRLSMFHPLYSCCNYTNVPIVGLIEAFVSIVLYSKQLHTGPLKFIHSAIVPPLSETSKLEMFGISAMQPSRIWEPPERNWKDTRTRFKTHCWVSSAQWWSTTDAQLAFIFCHERFLHWQKCTLRCLLLLNKSKD